MVLGIMASGGGSSALERRVGALERAQRQLEGSLAAHARRVDAQLAQIVQQVLLLQSGGGGGGAAAAAARSPRSAAAGGGGHAPAPAAPQQPAGSLFEAVTAGWASGARERQERLAEAQARSMQQLTDFVRALPTGVETPPAATPCDGREVQEDQKPEQEEMEGQGEQETGPKGGMGSGGGGGGGSGGGAGDNADGAVPAMVAGRLERRPQSAPAPTTHPPAPAAQADGGVADHTAGVIRVEGVIRGAAQPPQRRPRSAPEHEAVGGGRPAQLAAGERAHGAEAAAQVRAWAAPP
jgi:hypothetical protein